MKLLAVVLLWCFLAAALALALGAGYTFYAVKKAERRFPPRGDFLEIDGQQVHYLDTGGAGRPVVWIHGAHGSMYDFLLAFGEKSAGSYRFLFIDRPGFGYSTRPWNKPLTIFDQAEIIHEAVVRLGIEKPILAGHSLGSAVALAYASAYQEEVSAILLIAPYLLPYDGPADPIHYIPIKPVIGPLFMETFFLPVVRTFFAGKFLDKVFAPDPPPPEYAEMIRAMALRPNNYQANASDIRLFGPGLYRLEQTYASLKVPVIVIHGTEDRVAPFNLHIPFIEKSLPSLKGIVPLERTGHHPVFTRTQEIIEALQSTTEQRPAGSKENP